MSVQENNLYEFENFQIDLTERTLWYENALVPLAPKVVQTLCVLVENRGRLMTKDKLMDEIWADTFVEEKNLTQNISTLRKVFREKEKGKKFIETMPSRGYRFVAETRLVTTERQGILDVSYSNQKQTTAEGVYSKKSLTAAVTEITKHSVSDEQITAVEPKQIETRQSKSVSKTLTAILVLSFVTIGAAVWSWQNGYFNFGKSNVDANTSRPVLKFERLTETGNTFFPTVSPDNQTLAYVLNENNQNSILLQNIETGSTTEILSPKNYAIRSPQFSPDGNYLYYAIATPEQRESTIYRIPIFGGTPNQINTGVNQNFTVSRDGEWLAYFRNDAEIKGNHLVVSRKDGSDERIVATRQGDNIFEVWGGLPAWSPDGQKLVVSVTNGKPADKNDTRKGYFVEVNVADGSEKELNAPDWNSVYQIFWLADGSGFVASVQEKTGMPLQLRHLDYPGGEARPITNDSTNYTELHLAYDSSFIIVTEENRPFNIQLISVEDPTQVRQLTDSTVTQRGYLNMNWTPDGKELVFLKLEGFSVGNLWKMNVETLETAQLTFDKDVLNRRPEVTPDGNSIVFDSNRTGSWHIWQINTDGSNLRQITDDGGEVLPQVSSDGKWLVYATPAIKPDSLWKRPLAGGKAVKLLENAAGKSFISPDMKHIVADYYDSNEKEKNPWKWVLLPFEAGHKPIEIDFQAEFPRSVAWKADGSGLYYSAGMPHNNIWFYSPADKSVRQITYFDSQWMGDITDSPDGKTIAVARGQLTSNIYKISGF